MILILGCLLIAPFMFGGDPVPGWHPRNWVEH